MFCELPQIDGATGIGPPHRLFDTDIFKNVGERLVHRGVLPHGKIRVADMTGFMVKIPTRQDPGRFVSFRKHRQIDGAPICHGLGSLNADFNAHLVPHRHGDNGQGAYEYAVHGVLQQNAPRPGRFDKTDPGTAGREIRTRSPAWLRPEALASSPQVQ